MKKKKGKTPLKKKSSQNPLTVTADKRLKAPKETKKKVLFKASNEHLNNIINSLGDPVFVKNRDHTWVLLNDAYCEFMGYKRHELIGKSDYDFFPREEAEVFWNKDELVFNTGETNINEEKFTDSKGVTHIILTKKVLYSVGPTEDFIVGVISDITKLKEKEEEILYQKTILESVNEVSINGFLIVDKRGEVIFYNQCFADIWNIPEDVLITRSYLKFQQEIVEQMAEPAVFLEKARVIQGDIDEKERGEAQLKDGRFIDWYTAPIRWGDSAYGRVWYFHDVSEIKKAKEYAESANRTKTAFLANMSHELRTPLNAIIGFVNVLKEETYGPLNDKQKEFLTDVAHSGKHLLALINDILDLSKIESGKVDLDISEFSVGDLLTGSLSLMKDKTLKKNIEVITDIPEDLGTVYADERRIRQVVLNLLSNAVKFVQDGGKVGLSARRTPSEVVVTVWDNGIGIEPGKSHKIFKEFEQIDSSYSRQYGGSGLGLAISKKLVELHGGKIGFESKGKDKGASFTFTVPIQG